MYSSISKNLFFSWNGNSNPHRLRKHGRYVSIICIECRDLALGNIDTILFHSPLNLFQGSPLNRLSWLRESSFFLNAAAESPRSKWLLFRNGEPLVVKTTSDALHSLSYLSFGQIKELVGDDVKLFGQGQTKDTAPASQPAGEDGLIPPEIKVLQGARLRGAIIVFLGVKEEDGAEALPTNVFKSADNLTGTPYFGLDVSRVEGNKLDAALESASALPTKLVFMEPRPAANAFDSFDAPVFSLARSMLDWNVRNQVGREHSW